MSYHKQTACNCQLDSILLQTDSRPFLITFLTHQSHSEDDLVPIFKATKCIKVIILSSQLLYFWSSATVFPGVTAALTNHFSCEVLGSMDFCTFIHPNFVEILD